MDNSQNMYVDYEYRILIIDDNKLGEVMALNLEGLKEALKEIDRDLEFQLVPCVYSSDEYTYDFSLEDYDIVLFDLDLKEDHNDDELQKLIKKAKKENALLKIIVFSSTINYNKMTMGYSSETLTEKLYFKYINDYSICGLYPRDNLQDLSLAIKNAIHGIDILSLTLIKLLRMMGKSTGEYYFEINGIKITIQDMISEIKKQSSTGKEYATLIFSDSLFSKLKSDPEL